MGPINYKFHKYDINHFYDYMSITKGDSFHISPIGNNWCINLMGDDELTTNWKQDLYLSKTEVNALWNWTRNIFNDECVYIRVEFTSGIGPTILIKTDKLVDYIDITDVSCW